MKFFILNKKHVCNYKKKLRYAYILTLIKLKKILFSSVYFLLNLLENVSRWIGRDFVVPIWDVLLILFLGGWIGWSPFRIRLEWIAEFFTPSITLLFYHSVNCPYGQLNDSQCGYRPADSCRERKCQHIHFTCGNFIEYQNRNCIRNCRMV